MPRPLKIGNKWRTNLDMPCSGVACPRPAIPLPHKHRKRLSFDSKETCEQKIAELQKARNDLKHGTAMGEMSWLAFKTKFSVYSHNKNARTTQKDNLAICYLESYYPISELKQVTPELLGQLRKRLTDDGKRALNVNRIMTALKAMMRFAEDSKYITHQNWRVVKLIPTPKGRLHYWENDEITALYGVCNGTWETIARLAIESGLRREEIHTLKIKNVDFERNRIHIVGDENWTPKDYERRHIPMKQELRSYLLHICKKYKTQEYVLGASRPTLESMSTYFKRLVHEAGLRGSLHTGRHTYGSALASKGIPLQVIQKRMGHESIRTTEIYAHLCPDKMQEQYAA